MKNVKIIFVILVITSLFCFSACSDKKKENEIILSEYEQEIPFESIFSIPEAVVKNAEGEIISQSVQVTVIDPQGDELVIQNNSFVVSVPGIYTLNFSTENAPVKSVNIKCVDLQLPAVTDVHIDQDGIITFNCTKGIRYVLFIDGSAVGEIESGDDISEWIKVGGCIVEVQNTGGSGYVVSEKSSPIAIDKKARIDDVKIVENIITFSEQPGETYQLFNCGINQGFVNSGDDISDYFSNYKNEFSVRAMGSDGILNGDLSQSINFTLHPEIKDFSINENGDVLFTSYFGYKYNLYHKTEASSILVQKDIEPGQNFYEEINAILENETETFYVEILEGEQNKESITKIKSNEFTVQRLPIVTGVNLDENFKISFESESSLNSLLVNDEERDSVQNGDDVTIYLDGGEVNTLSIVAVPTDAGFWTSYPSIPIEKEVPQNYKTIEEKTFSGSNGAYFAKDALAYQKFNSEGTLSDEGTATILKGKSGSVFRLNRTLNVSGNGMNDSIIRFQSITEDGTYHLKSLKIRLISVADSSNYVTIEFYMGENGRTYVRASYQECVPFGAAIGTFEMTEAGSDIYSLGISLNDEAVNLGGVFDISYRSSDGVYAFYLQNARLNYGEYLSSPGVHCVRHLNWDHLTNQALPADIWAGLSGDVYMEIEFAQVDEYQEAALAVISVNGECVYGNDIHVSEMINGSVAVPEYALAGEKVDVQIFPDSGYDLYSYGVYSENGDLISLGDKFIMPDTDVSIQAVFRPKREFSLEREVTGLGNIWAAQSATAGEIVKISVLAENTWRIKELKVVSDSEKSIELSEENTFIMPEESVKICAIFEEISVQGNIFSGKGEVSKIEDGYVFEKIGIGEYASTGNGVGTLLQGKEGSRFRFNEAIDISEKGIRDSLVKFQTIDVNGNYNLQGLKVKLISTVDESDYVAVEFTTKSDGHTYATAYFPGSKDVGGIMSEGQSKPGEFSADGVDLFYASRLSLQNNMFGGDAKRSFELSYRTNGGYIFYLLGDNYGAWTGDQYGEEEPYPRYHTINHLDWNDFSNVAYSQEEWGGLTGKVFLEFEFTSVAGESAAIVVTDVQGVALNI